MKTRIGYVFRNQSGLGYVRFDQCKEMEIGVGLEDATIFTSQMQALDMLQTYVRQHGRWCSGLELHIVEEESQPVRSTRLGA